MNELLVTKHISIFKHPEKIILTFQHGSFKTEFIYSNGDNRFNFLISFSSSVVLHSENIIVV